MIIDSIYKVAMGNEWISLTNMTYPNRNKVNQVNLLRHLHKCQR